MIFLKLPILCPFDHYGTFLTSSKNGSDTVVCVFELQFNDR